MRLAGKAWAWGYAGAGERRAYAAVRDHSYGAGGPASYAAESGSSYRAGGGWSYREHTADMGATTPRLGG
ncbi:MAG: hypothetical protein U0R52_10060 [Solirubrobacterales bacterium]